MHRLRGSLGIAPAQRLDHRLVAPDRSLGTAFLFQRQRSRFDQQVVQRFHDAHDRAIAGGARENGVKGRVLDDSGSPHLEFAPLGLDDALQVGQVVVGHAEGRGARHGGLEHPAHVQELVAQVVAVGQDRRERRHEPVHVELARERALPVAGLEQADRLEQAQGIADPPAAHAEALGEQALARQRLAGRQGAVEDQHANAIGDFLGDARLLDWPDQAHGAIGGAAPGSPCGPRRTASRGVVSIPGHAPSMALDRLQQGCHTFCLNWLDHWASVP